MMAARIFVFLTLVCIAKSARRHNCKGQNNKINKVTTFNTALVNRIPSAEERRERLIERIKNMDSDVICLQEVYTSRDVQAIMSLVKPAYRFSHSALHGDNGKLNISNSPPCNTEESKAAFSCLFKQCDTNVSLPELLQCGIKLCNIWPSLSQECLVCSIVDGVENTENQCFKSISRSMNIPGLLLLSKRPLQKKEIVELIPGPKQLFPKSMLIADVPKLGKLACTHLTSYLGPVYFEPELSQGMFTSLVEHNNFEVKAFIRRLESSNNVIATGDFNTGPGIKANGIKPEFEESYFDFVSSGYTSPYVDLVGELTFQYPNKSVIVDHVMFKGKYGSFDAQRLFDDGTRLSDHFGVEVSFTKKKTPWKR